MVSEIEVALIFGLALLDIPPGLGFVYDNSLIDEHAPELAMTPVIDKCGYKIDAHTCSLIEKVWTNF